jgi:hypothetical protein
LAGLGIQTIRGVVHDASAVPVITLEVKAPGGGITAIACPGAGSAGGWKCDWDAGPNPANDALFQLRARAMDGYGNAGGWTGWSDMLVDTQPATLTLEAGTSAALADGILAPAESSFEGRLDDNHLAARIDICDAIGQLCEAANFALDAAPDADTLALDDAPGAPMALGATEQCLIGAPLLRTFTVSDSFVVANVTLGVNATLPARAALSVTLRSPAGTLVVLHTPGGADGHDLDVRWDDAGPSSLSADGADHVTDLPDYDNVRYPVMALGAFDGQNSDGVWTLSLCGADGQPSAYNHATLTLGPRKTPTYRGGTWFASQVLSPTADGLSVTLLLSGYDVLGNRTVPLTISYRVDNVAPILTLTAATATLPFTLGNAARPVLTGTVFDGGHVKSVFMTVRAPSGEVSIEPIVGGQVAGNRPESATPWVYALQPSLSGEYVFLITALDDAENATTIGPYRVQVNAVPAPVLEYHPAFIPMVMRAPAPALQRPEPATLGPEALTVATAPAQRGVKSGSGPPGPVRWPTTWFITSKDKMFLDAAAPAAQNEGSHE